MTPSSLLALEGKLVAAKGPSREIDFALYEGVGLATLDRNAGIWRWTIPSGGRHSDNSVPAYTSSIDAALALVSRVKPNFRVKLNTGDPTLKYEPPTAALEPHNGCDEAWSDWQPEHGNPSGAASPALAICLCLVRSLKGAGE